MTTRIALIHATRLAIDPIAAAFDRIWPSVERMNVLDDSLSPDRARHEQIPDSLIGRFIALADYARSADAAGILFTCSAFGPAIDRARMAVHLPMLKPNEAMFSQALASGSRIGMVSTFEPSIAPMRDELLEMAAVYGKAVDFQVACAPDALTALNAGEGETHDRLIVEQARTLAHCDVIMLGQFSMARAAASVQHAVQTRVLTSPECAVHAMKNLVTSS